MTLGTWLLLAVLGALSLLIGAVSRAARIVCPSCHGSGFIHGAACFRCRGRGWLT